MFFFLKVGKPIDLPISKRKRVNIMLKIDVTKLKEYSSDLNTMVEKYENISRSIVQEITNKKVFYVKIIIPNYIFLFLCVIVLSSISFK